jgi:hypothetical protein
MLLQQVTTQLVFEELPTDRPFLALFAQLVQRHPPKWIISGASQCAQTMHHILGASVIGPKRQHGTGSSTAQLDRASLTHVIGPLIGRLIKKTSTLAHEREYK